MLKSEKFFGKRDSVTDVTVVPAASDKPVPTLTVAMPASSANGTASPVTAPRVVPASITNAHNASAAAAAAGSPDVRSKLTVGPNIKLEGVEITECYTLVVEGRVEATSDSRVIQISEKGAFIGTAEFDVAEIRGEFDGDLTVRQKLVVYSSGRVTGKVRFGKLVIEEGGQQSGDVQLASATVKGLAVALG